jgi:hypothetical protein
VFTHLFRLLHPSFPLPLSNPSGRKGAAFNK